MAEINLIRKDRSVLRKVNQLRKVSQWVTMVTVATFLIQVFFITGKSAYLSWKSNQLDDEISSLEQTLRGREEEMQRYDRVKRRLEFILDEEESSYDYTAYLSEISSWLPSGTSLAAISFVNKEDIAFTLKADTTNDFRNLEDRLLLLDLIETNSLFSGLRQDAVSRSSNGEYLLKIIGRIK